MSQMSTEPVDITEIIAGFDKEIPCDWTESIKVQHGPARWRVVRVRCECGWGGFARLICDQCKDVLFAPDLSIKCAGCVRVYAPAREIVRSIDPL